VTTLMARKWYRPATVRKPAGLVGVRELRDDASALMASVERGDWYLLSKRGRLIAVLLPPTMAAELLREHAQDVVDLQLRRGTSRKR
jgi:prevent-host-death family protein